MLDNPAARVADLDQLQQIAGTYPTRGSFLTELTLDPPAANSAEAVPPHLDADYLVNGGTRPRARSGVRCSC